MTAAEVIAGARKLLAESSLSVLSPLRELEAAAAGDAGALEQAVEVLDSVTPGPAASFFMWADGGEAFSDGHQVGFVYRHNRKKVEILALMGRACLRAERGEGERWRRSLITAPASR